MDGGTVEDAAPAAAPRAAKPTILVPPRGPAESFFAAGMGSLGFSPGPMTLVSSFFAEQGPFSFSQLLAGAMASPMAPKLDFSPAEDIPAKEEEEEDVKSPGGGENPEGAVGYKRNRPMNLVVAQPQLQPESLSPMFMVPPGLSPSGFLNSPGFLSPLSPFGLGMSHQQALAHVTAQAALSQSYIQMQEQIQRSSSSTPTVDNNYSPSPTDETPPHHSNPTPQTEPETTKIESPEFSSQPASKKPVNVTNGNKPANDGYNWRKYGQKHVKGSECPRSYYKCTHSNCPVKKKVELSLDGRILEIVYKGQHNHAPPRNNNNNKRAKDGCGPETNGPNEAVEVSSRPANLHVGLLQPLERGNGDVENNVIVVDDGDDEEPIAKRRSSDVEQSNPVYSHQTITESKIVVQTRSEVDLLDDGYKWRKYGQKVVKGNQHPRSYYRCTYAGCNVRKHVERASADPKAVITTYEGKHNHEIPSRRFSLHANVSPPQPLKAPKSTAKNLFSAPEMDFSSQDKIPVTLHLKEEQIAA
ncbi:Probable WRKY transcription factor 4 [Striga hermonthica]|uniref:Probable WRKY transcription factor 4 n=1 Tax=Striga hermonthica TaxID=68872 RepID=A0A9N7RFK1_STRHE|nr:Probable WRKY transcription factor 4 [Striga hermonthica]